MASSEEGELCYGHAFCRDMWMSAWKLVTVSRRKMGLVLNICTLLFSTANVTGMALDKDLQPFTFATDTCATQASFGLLTTGMILQWIITVYNIYAFWKGSEEDDYHKQISFNFLSCLALLLGNFLYYFLVTSPMDFWYYFFGWDSVSFVILNTFLWFVTERYHRHADRFFRHKELEDIKNYYDNYDSDSDV